MMRFLCLAAALCASSALVVHTPMRPASPVTAARRAVQPMCAATTDAEKALLKASKKVTLVAKAFGSAQGKAAQTWVEEAILSGDASSETLVGMQLGLFEECKLDDGAKCKDLSEAMDALTTAVEERKKEKESEDPDEFKLVLGATPIQEAATKLRAAATKFGPEQKAAADAWMKQVTGGEGASAADLLNQEVTLFGECVLSEGSTPSNCEQLATALAELQEAIAMANAEPEEAAAEETAEETAEEVVAASLDVAQACVFMADASLDGTPLDEKKAFLASKGVSSFVIAQAECVAQPDPVTPPTKASGRKRAAVKRFLSKMKGKVFPTGGAKAAEASLDVAQACVFMADASLDGTPLDEKKAFLASKGVSSFVIAQAECVAQPDPVLTPA